MEKQPPVIHHNPRKHRFEIGLGNGEIGFAAYSLPPGAIRFYHTVVPKSHGGQGLGTALVKAGLAFSRERGLKVIPVCPFVGAYLNKHPDDQDIVHPAFLHLLGA